MNRSRDYYRKMRAKHIRRKKRINNQYIWSFIVKHDGYFSKNKIHCSCDMCSAKTNNKGKHRNYCPTKNWKHSDLVKIQSDNDQLKDYYDENPVEMKWGDDHTEWSMPISDGEILEILEDL